MLFTYERHKVKKPNPKEHRISEQIMISSNWRHF